MTNRTLQQLAVAASLALLAVGGDAAAQQSKQAAINVSRPPERRALLIGGATPAVSDGEKRLADILTAAYGFDTVRLDGQAATRYTIMSRLDEMASRARSQDSILVFVALPTATVGGRTYIVPADAKVDQSYTLLRVEDLAFSFDKSQAEGSFLIVPYCRTRLFNAAQQAGPESSSLVPGAAALLTYCAGLPDREAAVLAGLDAILRESTSTATGPLPAPAIGERLAGTVRDIQFEFRAGVASLGRQFVFDPIRDRLATALAMLQKDPSPTAVSHVVETTLAATREQRTADSSRAATALLAVAGDTKQPDYLRARAVQAIGEIRGTQSVGELRLLSERDRTPIPVRRAVVEALGRLGGGTDTLAFVRARMKDSDPGVRQTAVLAAIQLGDVSSTTTFIGLLRSDPVDEVRRAAIQALSVLSPTNPEARNAMVAALRDRDESVRREAAVTLSTGGANVSRELLAALRMEPLDTVRESLIYALANTPHAPSETATIESTMLMFADNRNPRIREAAVYSLGEFTSQVAQARVVGALGDGERGVQLAGIESAGRQRNQPAVSRLVSLLKSEPEFRVEILDAFSFIGDRSVIPQVGGYLQDDNEAVRTAASRTLAFLNAADELQKALISDSPVARRQAIDGLTYAKAVPVSTIIPALGDADITVRQATIRLLTNRIVEANVEVIVEAINSPDPLRQQSALIVLGNLAAKTPTRNGTGWGNAVATLDELLRMPPKDPGIFAEVVRTAGRLARPEWLTAFLQASTASDPAVRRAAAEALTKYSDEVARQRLRELASDPVADVQQAAGESLRRLEGR